MNPDKNLHKSTATTPKKGLMLLNKRARVLLGMSILLLGIILFFSFLSYLFTGRADQSVLDSVGIGNVISSGQEVENWLGLTGALFSYLFIYKWLGISSLLIAAYTFYVGFCIVSGKRINMLGGKIILFSVFWLSLFLGYFVVGKENESSLAYICGGIGYELAFFLDSIVGFATPILLVFLGAGFILLVAKGKMGFEQEEMNFQSFSAHLKTKSTERKPETYTSSFASKEIPKEPKENMGKKETEKPSFSPNTTNTSSLKEEVETSDNKKENPSEENLHTSLMPSSDQKEEKIEEKSLINLNSEISSEEKEKQEEENSHIPQVMPSEEPILALLEEKEKDEEEIDIFDLKTDPNQEPSSFLGRRSHKEYINPVEALPEYVLPSPDLLKERKGGFRVDQNELQENKQKILRTLLNFKIKIAGEIMAVVGPTVTLYELVPDTGIKISQIRNLADDIALSLAAVGIRIIAPMPGRGTIGIEVPNKHRETVSLKALLQEEKFQKTRKELPIVLGKTISNDIFITDLAKMPHLLIGGATGQGKSVGINVIIASLLYKKHPGELKFVLIDPKKVEFSLYSRLEKHYLAKMPNNVEPVVTDPQDAVNVLDSLCLEMDNRYNLLKAADCRQISEYNTKFLNNELSVKEGHHFLPYFVVIIDELADLMITVGKTIEKPIARLAQMARAVGIHLVVATQRPSVNVITGVIKANFPARMAFKVSSKVDSRVILDTGGAEQLIGMGDMLLSNSSEVIRLQCAYIDTNEVEGVCEFVEQQDGFSQAYPLPEWTPKTKSSSLF